MIINAAVTDSDTDEEEEGGVDYMGYQALGQDLNTFESGDEDQVVWNYITFYVFIYKFTQRSHLWR